MDTRTRIRSTAIRTFASERYLRLLRAKAHIMRKLRGAPPAVHYFHQVDDPYSHLAVQKLDELKAAYDIPFHVHLTAKPPAEFQGSSEHFDQWALRDALSVADDYGTSLQVTRPPRAESVDAANNRLAAQMDQPEFASRAIETGSLLWSDRLDAEALSSGAATAVQNGTALRTKRGHYQGAMFYFDGEWFWGIDRIRLLEARLIEEGFGNGPIRVPEPTPADSSGLDASHVVLEYFPSLRSPYTAVGHQRVLDLIARSGVTVRLRPVMPMLMRGIPAPFAKQQYIITDSAREARARGVPFGRIVDPFGEPVKRAFALFPAAVALGRGMEFVTEYLSAAWAEGIDIADARSDGLRHVAARAGIDWNALQSAARDTDWESLLESNVNDMLAAGLWGVPSFRVSGGAIESDYACWGQDRIWRIENEIVRRA